MVVDAISKSFVSSGGSSKAPAVLENVSFSLEKGEIASVVGPTGCGKTTLLRIMAGLIPPDSGKVVVNGQEVSGTKGSRTAIVFQNFNLLPWRNVQKNVEFGLELKVRSKDERRRIAETYVKLVGLGGQEKLKPHELSGGMQQRVGLARALALDPDVVLFDEPFSSVDLLLRESLQSEVLRILHETSRTAVFVTHNVKEAIFLSDKIVTLSIHPGRVKHILKVPLPHQRTADVMNSSEAFDLMSTIRKDLVDAQFFAGTAGIDSPVQVGAGT